MVEAGRADLALTPGGWPGVEDAVEWSTAKVVGIEIVESARAVVLTSDVETAGAAGTVPPHAWTSPTPP